MLRRRASHLLLLSIVVCLGSGCARPTSETASTPRRRIAVARFEAPVVGVLPDWIRLETPLMHDEMIAALVHSDAVDVVERTRLDTVLAEQKLTRAEITDPAEAARLGKVLGAGYFLIGTLKTAELEREAQAIPHTDAVDQILTGRVEVAFRLLEVETSRVVLASTAEIFDHTRDRNVDARAAWRDLAERAAEDVTTQVLDVIAPVTIVKVDGDAVELSRGGASGVRPRQRFEVLPKNDAAGGGGRRSVGRIEATRVDAGTASGRILDRSADIVTGMVCRPLPPPRPPAAATPVDPLEGKW